MKISLHRSAIAILQGDSNGPTSLTYVEAPPDDGDEYFEFEISLSSDDPPLTGTRAEIENEILDLIERKKFGPGALVSFQQGADAMLGQPISEIKVSREQLEDDARRVRNARRTWLIEQIEAGSFAAIELLQAEFGETVKIHVEITKEAA